jgi:hypothetical protein
MSIDWTKPDERISKYFCVREALWLPSWNKLATPTEEEKANILKLAAKLDLIREFIKCPMEISSWLRPLQYNKLIGGAPNSMHIKGLAADWTTQYDDDAMRKLILPQLSYWKIRMECLPGSCWVHVDLKQVEDKYRYFKP